MKSVEREYKGVNFKITKEEGCCSNMNGELPFKVNIDCDVYHIYAYRIEIVIKRVEAEITEDYI